jgi:hypothetical protein
MYRAEPLVVLSLKKIKSANVHLVLREQILTEIEVGQDMRAQTEWQGWRSWCPEVARWYCFYPDMLPSMS